VGGFWLAARSGWSGRGGAWFYRYTSQIHQPVFDDVQHPIREAISGLAAGPDGSVWAATSSNSVYRYDRLTGWDRIRIGGWDLGRVVTNPAPAYGIAVGPDGNGLVVGKAGRIADVSPAGAVLDSATGKLCGQSSPVAGPCGTGYDLHAAAVAPNGSALVGGDYRTVLWRAAGGAFRAVSTPAAAASARITAISMPAADHAWLATDTGQVFAGQLSGEDWAWTLDDRVATGGDSAAQDGDGRVRALNAISVDSSGHGWAVGDGGVILERTGSSPAAWQRVDARQLEDLTALAVSPDGKDVLVGGHAGLVLTRVAGRFEVAQPDDLFAPLNPDQYRDDAARVAGVAFAPGYRPGDLEAADPRPAPSFTSRRTRPSHCSARAPAASTRSPTAPRHRARSRSPPSASPTASSRRRLPSTGRAAWCVPSRRTRDSRTT
jgi:hypothetical protein